MGKLRFAIYALKMPYPLVTERLSISPMTFVDVDPFVRYRRDPVVAKFQGWDTTYSGEDAIRLVESQVGVSIPEHGDWVQLAIHDRHSGKLLGDLGLHSVPEGESTFEIGFTIAREHQRQGYATEAAAALIHHLFTEVGATTIVATTDRRNSASKRVLAALEFEPISVRSWTEVFKNEEITMDYFERTLAPLSLGRNRVETE
jgi:RimJ/RimL family protein N-acetyltransferase